MFYLSVVFPNKSISFNIYSKKQFIILLKEQISFYYSILNDFDFSELNEDEQLSLIFSSLSFLEKVIIFPSKTKPGFLFFNVDHKVLFLDELSSFLDF